MIVASQRAVTTSLPKGIDKASLKRLKHLNVVTRGGSNLGRVADVSVEVSSGRISQLILAENEYLDIDGRTAAIGSDIIVLPAEAKKKRRPVKEDGAGAKDADSVVAMLESTVNRVLDMAKKATEKMIAPTDETSGQAPARATKGTDQEPKKTTKRAASAKRTRKAGLPKTVQSRRLPGPVQPRSL